MKFPWQKKDSAPEAETGGPAPAAAKTDDAPVRLPKGYTPPKGRATPKRRDVERAKGIIRDPVSTPLTPSEARAQRKQLKASMSKEEWKALKRKEREASQRSRREAQRRMEAGEENYLLPRDKGPVRGFVRDFVDAHRYLNNYVMPASLVLMVMLFISSAFPAQAQTISYIVSAVILLFFFEGIMIGVRANRAARKKFPDSPETGFRLGFYAYSRASQVRRWRTPRPRVEVGDIVA